MKGQIQINTTCTLLAIATLLLIHCTRGYCTEEVLFERDLTGTSGFDFVYGSWEGNLRQTEEGIIIAEGCDNSGGAGFLHFLLNLADIPKEELFAVVEAKRLPTSSARLLGVLLVSKAGSDASCWQYPIKDISMLDFETIYFPLAKSPVYTKDSGLDFSNVIELQLQGDYTHPGEIGLIVKKVKIIRRPVSLTTGE